MLKWKRPRIPRAVRASYVGIVVALILVTLGLLGNVLRNPKVVQYFVRELLLLLCCCCCVAAAACTWPPLHSLSKATG